MASVGIPLTFEAFLIREFEQMKRPKTDDLTHRGQTALLIGRATTAMVGRELRGPSLEDFTHYDIPHGLTEDAIYDMADHYFRQSGFEIEGKSSLGILWMNKCGRKYRVNISLFEYPNQASNTLIVTVGEC